MQKNNSQKYKPVLVCGGTGLVGSALLRKFIEKGYANIYATYNNHKPHKYDGVTWYKVDLRNRYEVKLLFDKIKPHWVILAAAKVGGIFANNTYRAEFIYENLMIQNHVIHQSYLSDVNKLLFLGSSCIYPKNAPQPLSEDYLLTGELEYSNEPYAIAKIAGIKMCESYNSQYGTNFLSVMPTNLYGPNDNFDLEKSHVLPALIRKFHLGKWLMEEDWDAIKADFYRNPVEGIDGSSTKEQILEVLDKYGVSFSAFSNTKSEAVASNNRSKVTNIYFSQTSMHSADSTKLSKVRLWGSGKPRREFLYSDDMADACVFIMENVDFNDTYKDEISEIRNTHINIGCGVDCTIKELAKLIAKHVNYKGEIFFDGSMPDGTLKKKLNVEKLKEMKWSSKISLEKGVEMICDEFVGKVTK